MTITLDQIKSALSGIDVVAAMEEAFIKYSKKNAVVPPVGELLLDKGEVHIKYGYIKNDDYYVIKIASGFYQNPAIGLSSGNGLMLLFKQETGELVSILLDEGHLTDIRTAAAGAVCAKYLAPKSVTKIGIVGTGVQARLQLEYLKKVIRCSDVLVWGRSPARLESYKNDVSGLGFDVETTMNAEEILRTCNLVVTTTPSATPLLHNAELRPGTHITAVGSDTAAKQELDTGILAHADVVVADSISQCLERGEIHRSIEAGAVTADNILELGQIVDGQCSGRTEESQITVADLTGVAVQDIKIAEEVFRALGSS